MEVRGVGNGPDFSGALKVDRTAAVLSEEKPSSRLSSDVKGTIARIDNTESLSKNTQKQSTKPPIQNTSPFMTRTSAPKTHNPTKALEVKTHTKSEIEWKPAPTQITAVNLDDYLGFSLATNDNYKKASKTIDFILNLPPNLTTPYHKDGSSELYKPDAIKKRQELKKNTLVRDSIDRFMKLYRFDREGELEKENYIAVHIKLAKLLRKDLKDSALIRVVEEDWKHDSKGKLTLSKEDVFESLFELVDVWTPDIDVYQYTAFFDELGRLMIPQKLPLDDKKGSNNPYDIM